jgi:hypothetical protein
MESSDLGSGRDRDCLDRYGSARIGGLGFCILVIGQMIAFQYPMARLQLHMFLMVPAMLFGDILFAYGSVNVLLDEQSEEATYFTFVIICFVYIMFHTIPPLYLLGRWRDVRLRIEEVEGRTNTHAINVPSKRRSTSARDSNQSSLFKFEVSSALSDVLERGDIRLLSTAWLVTRPPEYVLERRQELPEKAFVSHDQAVSFLSAGRVALLSYRSVIAAHHSLLITRCSSLAAHHSLPIAPE